MAKHTSPMTPCLGKRHGGKKYLARRIVAHLPSDISTLVEPYAGWSSVSMQIMHDAYKNLVINDSDPLVYLVWEAILNDFDRFHHLSNLIDYTEENFLKAVRLTWSLHPSKKHANPEIVTAGGDPLDRSARTDLAVWCWVRTRFSRGGMGEDFAWSDRLRGGQPGDRNAWDNIRKNLPKVRDKLTARPVQVLSQPANKLIHTYAKAPWSLIYADPPYLHEKRSRNGRDIYGKLEMTRNDHVKLLMQLRECKGRVAISGYSHPLYEDTLTGWRREQWSMANHSGQNKKKQRRIECLWMNF